MSPHLFVQLHHLTPHQPRFSLHFTYEYKSTPFHIRVQINQPNCKHMTRARASCFHHRRMFREVSSEFPGILALGHCCGRHREDWPFVMAWARDRVLMFCVCIWIFGIDLFSTSSTLPQRVCTTSLPSHHEFLPKKYISTTPN